MEAAGEAAVEVFVSLRAGFAPSGHRAGLLPRVELTEESGAGPRMLRICGNETQSRALREI